MKMGNIVPPMKVSGADRVRPMKRCKQHACHKRGRFWASQTCEQAIHS